MWLALNTMQMVKASSNFGEIFKDQDDVKYDKYSAEGEDSW